MCYAKVWKYIIAIYSLVLRWWFLIQCTILVHSDCFAIRCAMFIIHSDCFITRSTNVIIHFCHTLLLFCHHCVRIHKEAFCPKKKTTRYILIIAMLVIKLIFIGISCEKDCNCYHYLDQLTRNAMASIKVLCLWHESFLSLRIYDMCYTHREIFSKSYQIKPKSDWIYHLPTDLEQDGRPLCSKSIGKW